MCGHALNPDLPRNIGFNEFKRRNCANLPTREWTVFKWVVGDCNTSIESIGKVTNCVKQVKSGTDPQVSGKSG
jgi:hypothetical protein